MLDQRPFSGRKHSVLKVLFWNAGGLNHAKFSELKHIIHRQAIDVFIVTEAGAATDNTEFYQLSGYTTHIIRRARQVASGIIVGTKNDITTSFKCLHEMKEQDKIEVAQIDAWLDNNHFRIVTAYNPPLNKFDNLILEQVITKSTIVIGDFNAPSVRWGYPCTSAVGSIMEVLIDNASLQPINTEPTFLSFAGQLGRPDLILPHANLAPRCEHQLLDDPSGCGHRIIVTKLKAKDPVERRKVYTRWNFKKAKWKDYAAETDLTITPDIIATNPDHTFLEITKAILASAKKHIPRGQVKKYAPFWSKKLTELKRTRNQVRTVAERSHDLSDCVSLRKAQACLQREITQSKRRTFRNFVLPV